MITVAFEFIGYSEHRLKIFGSFCQRLRLDTIVRSQEGLNTDMGVYEA